MEKGNDAVLRFHGTHNHLTRRFPILSFLSGIEGKVFHSFHHESFRSPKISLFQHAFDQKEWPSVFTTDEAKEGAIVALYTRAVLLITVTKVLYDITSSCRRLAKDKQFQSLGCGRMYLEVGRLLLKTGMQGWWCKTREESPTKNIWRPGGDQCIAVEVCDCGAASSDLDVSINRFGPSPSYSKTCSIGDTNGIQVRALMRKIWIVLRVWIGRDINCPCGVRPWTSWADFWMYAASTC